MAKKKRRAARRNPMAAVARTLRPKVVPSAKRYRRRPKHKGRGDENGETSVED
jgi:hypothetical protein